MLIAERKIDLLGRIVLPADMRQKLQLSANDVVRIVFNGTQIVIERV
ncbi:MAG: AbrB/MazE/SpoVT family DNA-binding domain-containing protein [Clostridia bacterium]|nr:AbrB/MazE/SpoVT family DNA-binding domain-containing protein [Clostridia bacterium]